MNLEAEILKEHSKRQTVRIAAWIGGDRARFKLLMELFLHGDGCLSQRAAWILSHCEENHPELITPWLKQMINKMQEPGVHDAVKRNVVRILQCIDIPPALQGAVTSLCFDYLSSPATPIAVKANAMTVLLNIVERKPDLKHELQMIIEQMFLYVGPALQSRGKKVLRHLARKT